jgi:hypothetical protein
MATVSELRVQAKARKIPRYYRMSKEQLVFALGGSAQSKGDARARSTAKQHGIAKSFAADKIGGKLGGGDEAKKAAIKTRIVKAVSKELKAHEKKIGRKLTIEEKRGVAVKALASEVRAIKSGAPEQKRRSAAETKAVKQAAKEKMREHDRKAGAESQKVHEHAIASGKTEQEANLEAFKTFQQRSIIGRRLAAEAEKKAKLAAVDGGKKRMTPIEGGNKTGVESLPTRMRKLDKKLHQQGVISKKESEKHQHLKSVEGGQTSLKDLYKEADRVGSKYQDKHDPADMGAHRQAKKIVAESGMGELHDRVTGKKTKRQTDKARMSVVDGGKKTSSRRKPKA